jgi:hypothetical protein
VIARISIDASGAGKFRMQRTRCSARFSKVHQLQREPGDIVVDGGNSYWGDSIRQLMPPAAKYPAKIINPDNGRNLIPNRKNFDHVVAPVERYDCGIGAAVH